MRKAAKLTAIAASLAAVLAVSLTPVAVMAEGAKDVIAMGKEVAYDRQKGNCLACHMMDDGVSPGTIGPPLVAMKARFPDAAKLRNQIYDATIANPDSMMIPFGKNKVLTDSEIDAIVEYLYTL